MICNNKNTVWHKFLYDLQAKATVSWWATSEYKIIKIASVLQKSTFKNCVSFNNEAI